MPKRAKGRHHADYHPRKESCSKQWANHGVDTHPARYGTLHKRRDAVSTWGGMMYRLLNLSERIAGSDQAQFFIKGRGLERTRERFGLYIQGRIVGYSDCSQYALAWARAAESLLPPNSVALVDRLAPP